METQVLCPKKSRAFITIAVSVPLIAIGVFLIHAGNPIGWVTAAFFGLLLLVGVVMTLPNSTYLELTAEGFGMRTLFRYRFVRWEDVLEFGVLQIETTRMVAWNYSEAYKAQARWRKFNSKLVGFEGCLPDDYGLEHEELAALMNERLARYRDPRSGIRA